MFRKILTILGLTIQALVYIAVIGMFCTMCGYGIYNACTEPVMECGIVKEIGTSDRFGARVRLEDGRAVTITQYAVIGENVCWETGERE
jgi:serine acetyltransferase